MIAINIILSKKNRMPNFYDLKPMKKKTELCLFLEKINHFK